MRAWVRRGRFVVTAVWMAFGCAGIAHAQVPQGGSVPDASPPPESMRTVDVTIVAGGDDADPLMGTIRELLGRLGLGVEPHLVAAPASGDRARRRRGPERVDRSRVAIRGRGHRPPRPHRGTAHDRAGQLAGDRARRDRRGGPLGGGGAAAVGRASEPGAGGLRAAAPLRDRPPLGPETPTRTATNRWFALDLTMLAGGAPVADGSGFVPRVGGGVVLGSRRRLRPSMTLTATYVVPFESGIPNVVTTRDDRVAARRARY